MYKYEYTPKQMAEKLLLFNRDFSDYEEDVKSEIDYLTDIFKELQTLEKYNVLAHHLDLMFMDKAFT